ncbi:hypothetical protein KM043_010007 [Ampulex compressa]|nr:hypothetical protein KM043_010007 [Ampulex compressa]
MDIGRKNTRRQFPRLDNKRQPQSVFLGAALSTGCRYSEFIIEFPGQIFAIVRTKSGLADSGIWSERERSRRKLGNSMSGLSAGIFGITDKVLTVHPACAKGRAERGAARKPKGKDTQGSPAFYRKWMNWLKGDMA